ncbi:MAG: MBL fold metallo-hydrolase [Oscillospiraceae bacterium]|nr:MBL fold metallo-hydrolase [Oscillospiraceae bacterium]
MSKKKTNKKRLGWLLGLLIVGLIALLPSLNIAGVPTWDALFTSAGLRTGRTDGYPLRVHFLDVGQGDSALIQSGDMNVLIDGGESGNEERVIKYLRNQNVKQLDYVIATHPDSDHIGALAKIMAGYPPKNVIIPKMTEKNMKTTKTYTNFLVAVKDSGAKAIYAKPGTEYKLGEAKLTILAPLDDYADANDMSIVCRVSYGKVAYLFTGDAEGKSEADLLKSGRNLRADVLKVGHHGSKSSTSKAFLAAVAPSVAVISCGQDNSYGHPHADTLKKLGDAGAKVYRTDQLGWIVLATDGEELVREWEKE